MIYRFQECGCLGAVFFGLILIQPVQAEIVGSGAAGFVVHETAHVSAPPDAAFAMLVVPQRWWDPAHTFSHDAANLSLEPRAGGCWCEALPQGGSVQHMTVVMAVPAKLLRLRGALGPLQGLGADGAMTWTIAPSQGGSDITLDYAVGGYSKVGLDTLAGPVDAVLGEQLARLKQAIDSGRTQ